MKQLDKTCNDTEMCCRSKTRNSTEMIIEGMEEETPGQDDELIDLKKKEIKSATASKGQY